MSGGGRVSNVSSDLVMEGVGDYDGSGRPDPVAKQPHAAGLHLADERNDGGE